MKKIIITLALLLIVTSVSFAEDTIPTVSLELLPAELPQRQQDELTRWGAAGDLAMKAGGFILGIAAGFAFHESGHQAAAWVEGVDMTWKGTPLAGLTWHTHVDKLDGNTRCRTVSSGGFIAQTLSTEVMLGLDVIPKDNSFVLGWLTFNIANNIGYVIQYETNKNGKVSDMTGLKRTGANMPVFETAMIGHALLSAYRIATNKDLPIFIGTTGKDVTVLFTGRF